MPRISIQTAKFERKTVQPKIIDAGSDKELWTGRDIGCTRLWLADEVCEWHANRLGSPSQFKR